MKSIPALTAVIAALFMAGCATGSKQAAKPTEISLLDLPIKNYHVGFADLWVGKNVEQRKVYLHGHQTTDYLFAHAPSWVIYEIPAGVTSFSAWGVRPRGGENNVVGSWIYIVKIDGQEMFHSRPLSTFQSFEVPVHVQIPAGSKEFELVVDDMSNNFCDHSIWAAPVFEK